MDFEITKQKAMALMGIESSHNFEEFENQHEQKLFEWKQELLQKYMVPSLIRSKLKLIGDLIRAEQILEIKKASGEYSTHSFQLSDVDRIGMLESYESALSQLKLVIMNAVSFQNLSLALNALIDLQENYMHRFLFLFKEYSEALPEEVNSREMLDTGKLLVALKNDQVDNKMSWAIEREISRIKKIQGIQQESTHNAEPR
jgi:hypothetical protein